MRTKRERQIDWALKFRREVTRAQLSRREIIKLGVLGSGAALLGGTGPAAGADVPIGPPTTPFIEPLPLPVTVAPLAGGQAELESLGHGPVNPAAHQYYNRFPAKKFYNVPVTQAPHSWHRELPMSSVWGYGGTFPGVTIDCNYGEPILTRIPNYLPPDGHDFGIPQVITHAHNFHTASESDGGPWGFYDVGGFRDHHYTMARAGFTDPQYAAYYASLTHPKYKALYDSAGAGNWGDPRESLGTVFYHSHRPDFTTANVYKGQLGFMRIFDEVDTGDETDGRGLQLPSGKYDVCLALADKVFDANGNLFFDVFNLEGIISDKMTVNGKIAPFFEVDRRKYRFRIVNGGPSRIQQLFLYNRTQGRWIRDPFVQIASDGNLLEAPVRRGSILVAVAERYDFVLDFREFAAEGDLVEVYNRLEQVDGRKPTGKLLSPGMPVLQFRVGATVYDPSRVPARLREQPPTNVPIAMERTFKFGRAQGSWAVNGRLFSPLMTDTHAAIRRNTAEIWNLENSSGGWVHPVHIHFEEHRVLERNGFAPPPWERGRKDVVYLGRGNRVRIFMQFRDFPDPDFNPPNPAYVPEAGRYVMHCHNTVHEDHAMMARWDIVQD